MAPNVVVSEGVPRAADVVAGLESAGCRVVMTPMPPAPKMKVFSPTEIEEYLSDAEAFICGLRDTYSRDVLEQCRRLKIGSSAVIGTEAIDVPAATDLGIVIGYGAVPENFDGVAEAIVMLTAAMVKELPAKWEVTRRGEWNLGNVGRMVSKRTVGMIGFGNIGRGVARRLAGWETTMLAYDPYLSPEETEAFGVRLVDLDTLLRESDVVSVQVTLTDETRGLIGEGQLELMKPTAFVINTSRGPVIDERALTRALDAGTLAGAAIDVWEVEPTAVDNPLRTHPRVIATSHKIGHSAECYEALTVAAVENTMRGLRGEEPLYVRNPKVLPAWRERLARLADAEARP